MMLASSSSERTWRSRWAGELPPTASQCPGDARKNEEMNTTERFYLPVGGVLEMFNSLTGHHRQSHATHPVPQSTANPPLLQHPKISSISKMGMGIMKTVQGRWRQHAAGGRSSSSGNRQGSTDRLPKGSVDLLELGPAKPGNRRRVVVLGAPGVGKTSILRRFLGEEFEERHEPTAEDFHRKLFHIGGEAYQVDLLDASSERDFPAKRRLSILTGDIFLLVFSLDDRDSLAEVRQLLDEIKAAKAKLLKLKRPARAPAVVCGNKADLAARRAVSRSEARGALGDAAPLFFETSARDGAGLEGAFAALAGLGGLPAETCPSRHQLVPILAYRSLCVGRRGRGGSREPCAAVDPLARRPSFTSDLRLVLGSSTEHDKPEKCPIQ